MTEKIFYQDSHKKEFTAQVLTCQPDGDAWQITLDRTAFFPEGGGQAADHGWISAEIPAAADGTSSDEQTKLWESKGIPVVDVQEKEDILYHKVLQEVPVGTEITGRLNWEERFDKMQQHTGEHILSGIVHELFQYNNVGFHLGSDYVTVDFNGTLTEEQLRHVERLANEAVFLNLPIEVAYPTQEELASIDYRSKIEIPGQIRIVTIPGYDVCACCAPHVKFTGEIGLIKITEAHNYKGGMRLSMACGRRALTDYQLKEENNGRISVLLSAKTYETANAVVRLQEELQRTKEKLNAFQQKRLDDLISSLPADTKNYLIFEDECNIHILRNAINEGMTRCSGICGGFLGNDESGYQFLLGSQHVDLRETAKALREAFQAKGGGKPQMIQGSVSATQEQLREFFNSYGSTLDL